MLITDMNENEIVKDDRVEYVGPDEGLNGATGEVDEIYRHGAAVMIFVMFDHHPGETFDILPVHLAVIHRQPCVSCALVGA